MPNIELGAIIDAVEATLGAAVTEAQSYDELTENIPEGDLPILQVWAQQCRVDPTGDTDRFTMGGGGDPHRHKYIDLRADLYAKARGSSIAEEMQQSITSIDAIMDVLETEDKAPFFGLATDQIKAFSWRWSYEVWEYAGMQYAGARFEIEVVVY